MLYYNFFTYQGYASKELKRKRRERGDLKTALLRRHWMICLRSIHVLNGRWSFFIGKFFLRGEINKVCFLLYFFEELKFWDYILTRQITYCILFVFLLNIAKLPQLLPDGNCCFLFNKHIVVCLNKISMYNFQIRRKYLSTST